MAGPSVIEGLRRDTERALLRGRNGLKYVTGIAQPRVGLSPKETIWTRGKASLWRYESEHRAGRRPLVIVYSIVGRSYVLDLLPGGSFVERMLASGNDVFLVDFGVPDAVDAGNTLETYVDNYLPRAIRAAVKEAGADAADVLGYCFGGLLTVLLAAGHPELPIQNLAVMAAPIDFGRSVGALQALATGRLEVDSLLDDTGNVPADAVHRMFRSLKPTAGIASYASLWERLWNDDYVDTFQVMTRWARDQVPFPGACAHQVTDLLLRRNSLMSGRVRLGGRQVRLGDIRCPVLNVIAEHDHVVTPASSRPLARLVSSTDASELLVPAGHIGLTVSRQAVQHTIPELNAWLMQRN